VDVGSPTHPLTSGLLNSSVKLICKGGSIAIR